MRERAYWCPVCGKKWTRWQPMSDPTRPRYWCRKCRRMTAQADPSGWTDQEIRKVGKGWTGTSKGDDRA